MKRKYIIIVMVTWLGVSLKAQQVPLFNTSLLNPVVENPAEAGVNKYAQGFMHYRKQWIDIEGAPESTLLTIDWPLKDEKSGLALIVSSDKINIIGHLGIMAAYSHRIKIDKDQSVRLGLGLNLSQNTIYFDKVQAEDAYESTLFDYFESATGVNAHFGANYTFKGLHVGLSAINLVNSRIQYSNTTENKRLYFQYIPQYYLHAGYKYEINDDVWVKPDVALRDLQGMPMQLEASLMASYQDKYAAGVIYRNKNSLGMLVSALIYERLTVSYAYQAALGEFAGYNGGTHEVTMGYRFYTSHYQEYKPVDDSRIDQILEFTKSQVEKNKKLEENNRKLKEEQQKLNEEIKREKEEITRLIEQMRANQEKFERARLEDETELEELPEDIIHDPNTPVYIIMGVFSDNYAARSFQQVLRREHKVNTEVLKRSNTNDYVVCVNRTYATKKELQREFSRLSKIYKNYSDADLWIYVNK